MRMKLNFLILFLVIVRATAYAQAPIDLIALETYRHESGVLVVLAETPADYMDVPAVYVGLYSDFGSNHEAQPGLAHLLEHMIANSYPAGMDVSVPGDAGEVFGRNAFARPTYSSYWISASPELFEAAARNRFSKVLDLRLDEAQLTRQKGRVLAELKRQPDSVFFHVHRALQEAFFGNVGSLEEEIAATEAYTLGEIQAHADRLLSPGRMAVVVVGEVPMGRMRSVISNILEGIPEADAPVLQGQGDFSPPPDCPVIWPVEGLDAPYIAAGYPWPARNTDDFYAALILDQFLLGGRQAGESLTALSRSIESPLGRLLVEKVGATRVHDGKSYGSAAPHLATGTPHYMEISFDAPLISDPADASALLQETLAQVRNDFMTDAAIEQVKQDLLNFYDLWLRDQSLRPLGDILYGMTIYEGDAGRIMDFHKRIRAIPPDVVRRVMDDYILSYTPRIAVLMPSGQ